MLKNIIPVTFCWIIPAAMEGIIPYKQVEQFGRGDNEKMKEAGLLWALKIVLSTLYQGQQITKHGVAAFHR